MPQRIVVLQYLSSHIVPWLKHVTCESSDPLWLRATAASLFWSARRGCRIWPTRLSLHGSTNRGPTKTTDCDMRRYVGCSPSWNHVSTYGPLQERGLTQIVALETASDNLLRMYLALVGPSRTLLPMVHLKSFITKLELAHLADHLPDLSEVLQEMDYRRTSAKRTPFWQSTTGKVTRYSSLVSVEGRGQQEVLQE